MPQTSFKKNTTHIFSSRVLLTSYSICRTWIDWINFPVDILLTEHLWRLMNVSRLTLTSLWYKVTRSLKKVTSRFDHKDSVKRASCLIPLSLLLLKWVIYSGRVRVKGYITDKQESSLQTASTMPRLCSCSGKLWKHSWFLCFLLNLEYLFYFFPIFTQATTLGGLQ